MPSTSDTAVPRSGSPSAPRVLLTSICRPLGEEHGDGPSVGYELLHGQVTRSQGVWSPRTPLDNRLQYSLEYIAENLDAPTTVLHYPTRRELVRELRLGYDYVGISFLLATFRHMQEMVGLIRRHSPGTKIVLGGYGTVLGDDVLKPWADHICREEGVGFMRRLLGEPERPLPYRQPYLLSRLELFGREVSRTGVVFAGLGCPNGCDFCSTSHFFKRKHVRLLPRGRDIYRAIESYLEHDRERPIFILDEDFLLDRRRALELRDAVVEGGQPLSIFAFASIRALSRFQVEELVELGIDGVWIGYEGTRAGFSKQQGRPAAELFRELREHGISILASMIIGLPYQTPEIIEEELDGLLRLEPDLTQFMIYGPTPGTPFYERVMAEGLLHQDLQDDRELYYRRCTGFNAMVVHPSMSPAQIERAQSDCFEQDFARLGPSVFRVIETRLKGYLRLRHSALPLLRAKAERYAEEARRARPAFLAGRLLAPHAASRRKIASLETALHAALGPPTPRQRIEAVAALGAALWTSLTLRLGLSRHPALVRHRYRMPDADLPARSWRRLRRPQRRGHEVAVMQSGSQTVLVRVAGRLEQASACKLAERLAFALRRTEQRLVLDLEQLVLAEREAAEKIAERLRPYRARIELVLPSAGELATLTLLLSATA